MNGIYLNSSFPRSGSTLIQNILAQNPALHTTPTDGLYEFIISCKSQFTNGESFKANKYPHGGIDLLKSFCRGGFNEYCNFLKTYHNREAVIIKSRIIMGQLPLTEQFLDEVPKTICMVRDLRGIVTSFEKIYRKERVYRTMAMDNNGTTTQARAQAILTTNPLGPFIDSVKQVIHEKIGNILFVRYEGLIESPQETLNNIYAHFEMDPFEHDFDNISQYTEEDDKAYGLSLDLHLIKPKIENRVNDFEEILGKQLSDGIVNGNRWFYEIFYPNEL